MITEVDVFCDTTAVTKSERGSITAPILFRIAGQEFPSPSWTDFAVVVLAWWLDAMNTVVRKQSVGQLRFMDGPYWIELKQDKHSCWLLTAFEERSQPLAVVSTEIDIHKLSKSIVTTATKLLSSCKQQSWDTNDLQKLELVLDQSRSQG